MYQLYYVTRASSYFSSMDGTLYVKVRKDSQDYYIPFLTLVDEISNTSNIRLDSSCPLSSSTIKQKLFLRQVQYGMLMNQRLLRESDFDFRNQSDSIHIDIESGNPPILVTSIEQAVDAMLTLYLLKGNFHTPDYLSHEEKEKLYAFYRKKLHPYFPELCAPFRTIGPQLFL